MEQDQLNYLQSMQNEVNEEKAKRIQSEQNQVATMFSHEDNENLIKFQLDIEKEIERIEHLIRKHVPYINSSGSMDYKVGFIDILSAVYETSDGKLRFYYDYKNQRVLGIKDIKNNEVIYKYGASPGMAENLWDINETKNSLNFKRYKNIKIPDILLNDEGVNEVLNLLAWYVNKTFLLSDFDEDEINLRVWHLGKDLASFLHKKYKDFGLDTPEKLPYYDMLCTNLTNTIEAVYHRALYGKERDSLRQARIVSQSENLNSQPAYPQKAKSGFNILKPSSW